MYSKFIAIAIVATILMLVVTPAGAITYGEPDGNRHPNVGLMVADLNGDGKLTLWCSGTLISPTVFLTAGHCTNFFSRLEITNTWITFDSEFDPELEPQTSKLIPLAGFITHPDFNPHTLINDVGVVILAEEIQDVTPGMLPPENLLEQMKAAGTLKDQTFVNVGYGATADFKGHPPLLPRDGVRRFSTSPYLNLTPNNLGLLENHDATGEGGGCFGDSGGPHFLGDSNLIVSVTSWGDAVCRSLGMTQRVDTPSVRAFLDDYVTLP
jgi:secreted trypsin-like serine protease